MRVEKKMAKSIAVMLGKCVSGQGREWTGDQGNMEQN